MNPDDFGPRLLCTGGLHTEMHGAVGRCSGCRKPYCEPDFGMHKCPALKANCDHANCTDTADDGRRTSCPCKCHDQELVG